MFWGKVKLVGGGTDYWCHFPYGISWYVIATDLSLLPAHTHTHTQVKAYSSFHILVSNTTSGTVIVSPVPLSEMIILLLLHDAVSKETCEAL